MYVCDDSMSHKILELGFMCTIQVSDLTMSGVAGHGNQGIQNCNRIPCNVHPIHKIHIINEIRKFK